MSVRIVHKMFPLNVILSQQFPHSLTHTLNHTGPLYIWSMFPAEDTWNWLMNNARNTASPEATMHFSWQDNQFSAMWHLQTLDTEKARYYIREDYINDPDLIDISVAGIQTPSSFDQEEHADLIIFYTESWEVLGILWRDAVRHYAENATAHEMGLIGLKQLGPSHFEFEGKMDIYRFYLRQFARK